jgi:hypothetical protein
LHDYEVSHVKGKKAIDILSPSSKQSDIN